MQVYICEMDMDVSMCTKRNIHNRTEEDIADIVKNWEETPRHHLRVDVRSLLQSVAITEVSTAVPHVLNTLGIKERGQRKLHSEALHNLCSSNRINV
jgi:YLP motif-containing protein 1